MENSSAPAAFHPISNERLDAKQYFPSLINEACLCGLLSESDAEGIRSTLLNIFSAQMKEYCGERSSSVTVEKAREISDSVMFTIGLELKTYEYPEEAAAALKKEPLKTIFDNGLDILRRKLVICRKIQRRIAENLFETPNVYYRSTVIDGINGFFKLYSPEFSAREIHITADYPLLAGRPDLDGVEFIEAYLRWFEAENLFCVMFDSKDIHGLMCGLTKDYRSCPVNIFESVMLAALGLVILNRNPRRLDLSQSDVRRISDVFCGKTTAEIQNLLDGALEDLNWQMQPENKIKKYAAHCIPLLAYTVYNAVRLNNADKIFLVPDTDEEETEVCIFRGDRMDNGEYAKMLDRISAASGRKKAEIIIGSVRSAEDLLDVLNDAELCAEEYEMLMEMLPASALAVLYRQYPNGDILERKSEKLIQAALQKRLERIKRGMM